MRIVQPIIDWTEEWFIRPWADRLQDWLADPAEFRAAVGYGLVVVVMAGFLAGVALLLLWVDSWWPDRLIPWIPFERI